MAEIAKLYATVSADSSKLQKGLEDSRTKLGSVGTAMSQLQTGVTLAFAAMGAAAGAMAIKVAQSGVDFLALKEQADIAFTTMLGSGEAAQRMLDKLQDFAAETPFEFPDLIRASQRMMAMGFSAGEVIPTLTAVGDAVAALGGGQAEIDRVTTALGQMNAKGKTSAEEMMQLTEAGIPAWQMLADKIGVTVPEAMKQVTAGAVSADTTISAVVEGINTRFGGMMEKQSTTWNGMLSNLSDGFTQMSAKMMQPFFDKAKAGLTLVVPAVNTFNTAMNDGATFAEALMQGLEKMLPESWMDAVARAVEYLQNLNTVVSAAIQPIADAIGKFVSWKDVLAAVGIALGGAVLLAIGAVVSAMTPMIATLAAITAAVAAFRWAWENDFGGIRTFTKNTLDKISEWFFTESGLWKGNWEDTAAHIADSIRRFFQIDIYNYTVGTWSNIRADLIQAWTKLRDKAADWSIKIRDAFQGWLRDTEQNFNIWKDKLIGTFNKFIDPIKKDVTDWATVTKSTFDNWMIYLVGKFTQWKDDMIARFQPVFDWWDKHVQPWIQAGKDVIQGLWDGIKEKWNNLRDWFTGVWNDLTDRFKRFFGIASPSTLFRTYGDDMMAGLRDGIDAGSGMVFDSMDAMNHGIAGKLEAIDGLIDMSQSAMSQKAWDAQMKFLEEASKPTLPYWLQPDYVPPASTMPPVLKDPNSGAAEWTAPSPKPAVVPVDQMAAWLNKTVDSVIGFKFSGNTNILDSLKTAMTQLVDDAVNSDFSAMARVQGLVSGLINSINGDLGGMTVGQLTGRLQGLVQDVQYHDQLDGSLDPQMVRNNELLTILIQELRNKNMTANFNVVSGGSYSDLVAHTAGMQR